MSRGTPAQVNFNGGEISQRLRGRHDLNIYDIAVGEMTGFAPLVEGGMEAAPGLIRVAQAKGPCRLVEFTYNATQSYVIEMSAGMARFYTNDARIESPPGTPVELALPWTLDEINALTWHKSYDVLYLFHGDYQSRKLVRTGADSFTLDLLTLTNGPFEPRNSDESLIVTASGVEGDVTLEASSGIFESGDVGGLFQMEADDFGDITSWEPGITVSNGQLLTWNDVVYRVAGGTGRTGTVAPVHRKGVEWDGIGQGTDVNDKAAGGVQLEYVCDRLGILRITAFTSATEVNATVLRRLPFTSAASYTYTGGYYDSGWGAYVPPDGAVAYQTGTWRWRFGAFSNRRGWPTCGVIWDQRLVLARQSTVYAGVSGDIGNHATYNEEGEISTDMAFVVTIDDPNPIVGLIAGDDLAVLTGNKLHVLGPSNAAQGVGPNNVKVIAQINQGASKAMPAELDGRILYISNSRRKVIEADYKVDRDRQGQLDLTRYARHMGQKGRRFTALAVQNDPHHLLWATREDGTLASAVYLPEEQCLGWWNRRLAPGMAATSLCSAMDPDGELNQIWVAATWRSATHVCLMAPWRQEGDASDPVMVDMALEYAGAPRTDFGPISWLTNATVDIQADERVHRGVVLDGTGSTVLDDAAARVVIGVPFEARATTLPISSNGDNGPARDKKKRIGRIAIDLLEARGLAVRSENGPLVDIENLVTDESRTDEGYDRISGIVLTEDMGDFTRDGTVTIERVAPTAATIRAVQPTVEVAPR